MGSGARVNEYDLPVSDEGIYQLIHKACDIYNDVMELEEGQMIEFDDMVEEISIDLDRKHLNLFVEIISYLIYQGMFSQFVSDSSVYQSSMGIRDYKSQYDSRKELVDNSKEKIDYLASRLNDMGEDLDGYCL